MSGVEKTIVYVALALVLGGLAWIGRRVARLERRLEEQASPADLTTSDAATIKYEREDTLTDFLHSRKQEQSQ
jgi:hypothetical protein